MFQEVQTRLVQEMKQVDELRTKLAKKEEPANEQLDADNTALAVGYKNLILKNS